jgi:hypothetical protein
MHRLLVVLVFHMLLTTLFKYLKSLDIVAPVFGQKDAVGSLFFPSHRLNQLA